jgi:hypothetical protein
VEIDMDPNDKVRRETLPIPDVRPVTLTTYDAKDPDTKFPPITPVRPPAGAPNVLIVLLDDVGFGASSAFGGPCSTPTAERLAAEGLKYTRFHTTARHPSSRIARPRKAITWSRISPTRPSTTSVSCGPDVALVRFTRLVSAHLVATRA